VNLADVCAAEKVFEDAVAAFGRIDGLLNIAGIMDTNNSVDTLTDALWDRVISINLTAPVKLMRAVVSHMIRAGGGSILNVPSKVGTSGAIAGVTYTSRKHGIVSSLFLRYDTSS
jgi:NAD(P)-dependent dehydrogenase (short-subunit alcohol dehydrogenase family)